MDFLHQTESLSFGKNMDQSEKKPAKTILIQGVISKKTISSLAKKFNLPWVSCPLSSFSCGEWECPSLPDMGGLEVILVHDLNQKNKDPLMALGLLCTALHHANVQKITLIAPCLPYGRNSNACFVLGNILISFHIKSVITLDPHRPDWMPNSSLETYALSGLPIFLPALKNTSIHRIISPDCGGKNRARTWATQLDCPWSCLSKKRTSQGIAVLHPNPEWKNETCLIVDDLVDTGDTLVKTSAYLLNHGAKRVVACITHGVFSQPFWERIKTSGLDTLWISDSIPQPAYSETPFALHILPWTNAF